MPLRGVGEGDQTVHAALDAELDQTYLALHVDIAVIGEAGRENGIDAA